MSVLTHFVDPAKQLIETQSHPANENPIDRGAEPTVEELLVEAVSAGPARRARIHSEVVARTLDLARVLALRYRDRGEPLDDLIQVANTGLVLAVQRYRPAVGARFASFATPTILGELRRYFRDQCWAIRPPRRVQETLPRIRAAAAELQQRTAQPPTLAEVAAHLSLSESEVVAIEHASRHYNLASLDGHLTADGEPTVPQIAAPGNDIDEAITKMAVESILADLSERDREIVQLRYFDNLTQQQIADRIGVSQMQVSRLLKGILRRLRESAADDQTLLMSA